MSPTRRVPGSTGTSTMREPVLIVGVMLPVRTFIAVPCVARGMTNRTTTAKAISPRKSRRRHLTIQRLIELPRFFMTISLSSGGTNGNWLGGCATRGMAHPPVASGVRLLDQVEVRSERRLVALRLVVGRERQTDLHGHADALVLGEGQHARPANRSAVTGQFVRHGRR